MSLRSKFFVMHFFFFVLSIPTSANITAGWEKPFLDTIRKLKATDWQSPLTSKKEFSKNALATLRALKKNSVQWKIFLDQEKSIDDVVFDENSYVSKIFSTKKNTLIFKIADQPHAIIKIDQRKSDELDHNLRSYFHAYEKTQAVQKTKTFTHLYLPMEYGKKSNNTSLRYVIAEEVPVFSEAEIDNIALLILIHNAIDNGDQILENEVKISFSNILQYICSVDFDDINYRNITFTKDGRLAPIDTDSYHASTGVFSFIEYFFAFKLFPTLESVQDNIPKECFAKLKINSYLNPYVDDKRLESSNEQFDEARKYLDNIISFLKTRKARIMPRIVMGKANHTHQYVDIVNEIIFQKISYSSKKKFTFGWRCEHARNLITEAAEKIRKKNPLLSADEADDVVRQILTKAKKEKILFNYADLSIQVIENIEGIKGFICF